MIIPTLLMTALLAGGQVAPEGGAGHAAGADGPSEAEALVKRIKETLGRIDESLYEVPYADDVAAALEDVRQSHLEAIRDIEELIKQARYSQSKNPSGGGGGGGGGGQQQQQQQQQQPRDSDGSNAPDPSEQQGGNDPRQEEQQGQGEQEQEQPQGGQTPQDGMPSGDDPSNGQQPPRDPLGDPTRDNTDGRWGLLPPKVQEQLMNLHVDDVPVRYRSWLQAYVKALNAAEQEGGGR